MNFSTADVKIIFIDGEVLVLFVTPNAILGQLEKKRTRKK